METQTHREMAQTEIQQERTKKPMETMTEEQFLKDLYLFMKKRDSPIERIPNLGFKQIDLFVMFKVVKDFGGYHQVTAQQLWKQVYNTLGGNPRSTSAATCTRRHYEKLLLPYECHLTGTLVNVLPRNQSKHFHYANYREEHEDGQRPPKRKLLSMPLIQNPQNLQPDLRDTVFPLPPPYAHYFHPGHAVLPPHVPLSSPVFTPHCPPAPDPWFVFPPSHLHPTDRVKEPLEQLRNLAEQYKTTSGLTSEPLNLSVKASRQETNGSPASSFTPPSSSKSPKFLNRPSPLYTGHHQQVVRDDGCETQNGEAGSGDAAYSHPAKASEPYVIDVDATAASSPSYSPAPGTDGGATAMPRKPDSPRPDLGVQEKDEREGSPEVKELSFSHALPSLPSIPRENEGRMEIEIPLSVFNNWLRQCGSSAAMLGAKQLNTLAPPRVELSEQRHRSGTDFLPTNLTFHTNPRHQSSGAEDLRLARKRLPSPSPGSHAAVFHHNASQSHFTTYKPLSSSGIRKNAVSQDVYPFDIINKCKPLTFWDVYGKESQASPIPVNSDSSPRRVQQDFATSAPYDASLAPYVASAPYAASAPYGASAPYAASAPYGEDRVPGGKKGSDMAPSAVYMLNSSSTSLLHLTTEEVMKLKKIISSSS